jgi:hypothetical protein
MKKLLSAVSVLLITGRPCPVSSRRVTDAELDRVTRR